MTLIFLTKTNLSKRIHSLKYIRSTTSRCKVIGITKLEFEIEKTLLDESQFQLITKIKIKIQQILVSDVLESSI